MDITVITAILGPTATILGVGLTLFFTNRREANRLQHERGLKMVEERRKAYATLARITKNTMLSDPLEIGDLSDAQSEVEMLTEDPLLLSASEQLVHAAHRARQLYEKKRVAEEERGVAPPHVQDRFTEAKGYLEQHRTAFLNAARRELGLGPKPSPPKELEESADPNAGPKQKTEETPG